MVEMARLSGSQQGLETAIGACCGACVLHEEGFYELSHWVPLTEMGANSGAARGERENFKYA